MEIDERAGARSGPCIEDSPVHAAAAPGQAIFRQQLDAIKKRNLYRFLRTVDGEQGAWVEMEGKKVLNLCSNNYLGLASHPRIREKVIAAVDEYGFGSGASRLICGNMALHERLEQRLADFEGTEATLLYNSGYTANLGIISALVGYGDYVFSDQLNHASIIDGCRLSRANIVVFPHNDLAALARSLQESQEENPAARRLVAVDGVFSMDGDIAPLPALSKLAADHGALLMVDEAHATGAIGPGGRGSVAHFGLDHSGIITMGTLSKALGGFGAFAGGTCELREYLINVSRAFIFTTALPASVAAASLAALEVLQEQPEMVSRLQENGAYLRSGFKHLGLDTLTSQTQIIPVMVGDAALCSRMSEMLLAGGVLATAIRPPTVPEGTSRIRVSVMATHSRQDLDFALEAFQKAAQLLGVV